MQRFVLKLILIAMTATGYAGFVAMPAGAAEETPGTSCSSNSGVATLSPGIEEAAKVQNITVKGLLSGCTGSTGVSAKYVAHLKTTTPVSCASLNGEGMTAEGTVILKWGHGTGNSQGTLVLAGSPGSGLSLSGAVAQGPFAGLSMSSTLSAAPVFKGKGEPCNKKNRLKRMEVAGTTPFTIA